MHHRDVPEEVKRKVQLYTAAIYLFNMGRSYPQIIEMLTAIEPDNEKLTIIVDKAMHESWDKLYEEARDLFAKGEMYDEVLKAISEKEPDIEVATWICGEWYEWKTYYLECIVDGPVNRFEGTKWVVITLLGLVVLFCIHASPFVKDFWIFWLLIAIGRWLVGMKQRNMLSKIEGIFSGESIDLPTTKVD